MTKRELAEQLATAQQQNARLKNIGAEMANLCFNGKQCERLPREYRESMALLVERWDAAMKESR